MRMDSPAPLYAEHPKVTTIIRLEAATALIFGCPRLDRR